jgi:hypothetical protein
LANFNEYSRYTGGQIATNTEGQQFLVLRSSLNLPQQDGDIFVVLTQDIINRPDLISYKAYGIPDLWWVIYEYNNISDPIFGLTIGQTIRLPEISRVLTAINALNLT